MTNGTRALSLVLVALLAAACVVAQPSPAPSPTAPIPSAGTTAEPTPTITVVLPTAFSTPTATATSTPAVNAQPSPTSSPIVPPKAVFIVGPEDELTAGNLAEAEEMALQAEAAGMEVHRVFFPNATWDNVLAKVQGASLVAYLGHGYGFPSNTVKLTESQQNGMGLNAFDGSTEIEVKYYGATPIREKVRLAPHAVVLLMHGCYTSGNGLWGTPIPTEDVARERVDNYASGWLAAGAGAVFAFQFGTQHNYAAALAAADATIDELFMRPQREYAGWNDLYFESVRTPGAISHLDPDPQWGFTRAVTGDLLMTTATWRSGAGQMVPAANANL